ncbi:MAG TPA: tRNA guanosine(34) transglycosylase Tgt [Candidatus Diapherotrites archaeon]|uniref:tRNA guanosine(34) transglycosylase Tgt n=1 Tax=Candidatus Iainarchaeum sp. TaxID=3101447 RepID=A0A7J4J2R6_9ARCH|nr:tRNA guanosine(34) transglycosylase Tgt [Candidatus Diapherotrites archaeon]
MPNFTLKANAQAARAGELHTGHGTVKTPFLMPVATKGSVKLLSNEEVESTGTQCLISNAFILSMKPGLYVIEKHKGLHNFMEWKRPLFTDSGGFQVLSKEFCLGLSDEGVRFRNPFTGKSSVFSPEHSIEIQNRLGSDVAMCLDDVPHAGEGAERVRDAVKRTIEWAKRCKEAHSNKKQMLFGIAQGGINKELREECTKKIIELGFDGVALGGLSIGETKGKMFDAIGSSIGIIPQDKPRYLMGVGSLEEMLKAISLGVDCFDSCFATRTARHGRAFTSKGNINIDSAVHRLDLSPLDEGCGCFVCKKYSRSYIHHLFRTKEENAGKYLTYHNIFFVQNVLAKARKQIVEGTFRD